MLSTVNGSVHFDCAQGPKRVSRGERQRGCERDGECVYDQEDRERDHYAGDVLVGRDRGFFTRWPAAKDRARRGQVERK